MNEHIQHLVNNIDNFSQLLGLIESSDNDHKLEILAYYIAQAAFNDDFSIESLDDTHFSLSAQYDCVVTMADHDLISESTKNFIGLNRTKILTLAYQLFNDFFSRMILQMSKSLISHDSVLHIKINSDIKNAFSLICRENDTTLSREVRRFIEKSVKQQYSTERNYEKRS